MSGQRARRREVVAGELGTGESNAGATIAFEQWAEAMRGEFEAFLRENWEAMRCARKGRWIADTEEVMLKARDQLGRRAYEKLLELQIEAGQQAFSPSGSGGNVPEQGP